MWRLAFRNLIRHTRRTLITFVPWGLDHTSFMSESMEVAGVIASSLTIGIYEGPVMVLYGLGGVLVATISAAYPAMTLPALTPVDAMRGP